MTSLRDLLAASVAQTARLLVASTLLVAACGVALGGCSEDPDAVLDSRIPVPLLVDFVMGGRKYGTDVAPNGGMNLRGLAGGCVEGTPRIVAKYPDWPLLRPVRAGNAWCTKKGKVPKWIIEYVP